MDEQRTEPVTNGGRRRTALAFFGIVTIVGLAALLYYLHYKSTHISTDDAFIAGRIHTVAARVPGTVKTVRVEDNALVKKGDVLAEIDEADYAVRVAEASSSLTAERAKLTELERRVEIAREQLREYGFRAEAAKANLSLQEAQLRQADIDLKRAEGLIAKDAISKERFDRARTASDVAVAQVKAARDQLRQAEASLSTQQAVIRQAEASLSAQKASIGTREAGLKAAELNNSYTRIMAPSDGYVTKKSVEAGNQIQAGQPLMAIVPLHDIWVVANYKETQLEKVRAGQQVDIEVDTFPKKVFKGKVESIMAGTGAVFSLFPPENATGNFVKIVQRIPVKIVLDRDADPDHVLRMGMSVVPTVIAK